MSFTIEEIKERLLQEYDQDTLLELLDISAEELLERFHDKVEANYNRLLKEII